MHQGYVTGERTVHYVYERDSFVPLVQVTRNQALEFATTTDVKGLTAGNDGKYDLTLDPLWNGEFEQKADRLIRKKSSSINAIISARHGN